MKKSSVCPFNRRDHGQLLAAETSCRRRVGAMSRPTAARQAGLPTAERALAWVLRPLTAGEPAHDDAEQPVAGKVSELSRVLAPGGVIADDDELAGRDYPA
jgi:hypothetical protein